MYVLTLLALIQLFSHNAGASVKHDPKLNVLGTALVGCGSGKATGFYRDGYCSAGPEDHGIHVVCAEVTQDFLEYSKSKGNDLITPRPESDFPGLVPGDRWCLCAARWREAFDHGVAPPVVLEATQDKALAHVKLDQLKKHELGVKK